MFTSRAEHRLLLRADNADLRLTPRAVRIGLVDADVGRRIGRTQTGIDAEIARLRATRISPTRPARELVESKAKGEFKKPLTLAEILERNGIAYTDLSEIEALGPNGNGKGSRSDDFHRISEQVEIAIKYRGYLERQQRQIAEQHRMEAHPVPVEMDFHGMEGMRIEARQRLANVRPLTLGQASRVEGVSPADIAVLMAHLKRNPKAEVFVP
jgi:tRNA uridine 5-carboxymethylaminomethyl modification enzyme